jgi:hypothetical protein
MVESPTRRLHDFAASFIADIDNASGVRSEALAEALRSEFGLSNFPSIAELRHLCLKLGVPLHRLPDVGPEVLGGNVAYGENVAVFLRPDLSPARAETTLCHELREVLENAFSEVKDNYHGRRTSDNTSMNPVSDRFAAFLLMRSDASSARLRELGFDFGQFARETGRSLPSVVRRSQQLFNRDVAGPVLGTWLFDAPWESARSGNVSAGDFTVRHRAKLCGFTQSRGTLSKQILPSSGSSAAEFELTRKALAQCRPLEAHVDGMALAPMLDYVVVAEPFLVSGRPWRLHVTAVRRDCLPLVGGWLARLGSLPSERRIQRL